MALMDSDTTKQSPTESTPSIGSASVVNKETKKRKSTEGLQRPLDPDEVHYGAYCDYDEKCTSKPSNLAELFKTRKDRLLDHSDYPFPLLWKIMRDIVGGVAKSHDSNIIHGNLKPENVSIISGRVQIPEPAESGGQTIEDDLFALGNLLFFCVSGGEEPGTDYDVSKISGALEQIPEVVDVIIALLDPSPVKRPKASQVLRHPLCWDARRRLEFLLGASYVVDKAPRDGAFFQSLMEVSWEATIAIRKFASPRCLKFYDRDYYSDFEPIEVVEKLERLGARYKSYRSIERYLGLNGSTHETDNSLCFGVSDLELFEDDLRRRFPKILIELYKVMLRHAAEVAEIDLQVGWEYFPEYC